MNDAAKPKRQTRNHKPKLFTLSPAGVAALAVVQAHTGEKASPLVDRLLIEAADAIRALGPTPAEVLKSPDGWAVVRFVHGEGLRQLATFPARKAARDHAAKLNQAEGGTP